MSIRLFLLNKKGLIALSELSETQILQITSVVIGQDKNLVEDYSKAIADLCESKNINFQFRSTTDNKYLEDNLIAIGWRWLIPVNESQNLFVFHDSILPKFRGFNPLVTCLINGENKIGVTCMRGENEYDRGNIIFQAQFDINYPLKIVEAINIVSNGYSVLLKQLLDKIAKKEVLSGEVQNEIEASYSVWRDKSDYYINWNTASAEIKRFVDAVGFPFEGAQCFMDGEEIIIDDVEVIPDLNVENRGIGKVLYKVDNLPIVICGSGLLKILNIRSKKNEPIEFPNKFRYKFT